jgi:hypothetical protein
MNVVDMVESSRKSGVDYDPRPNAVTLAALREAEAIATGKIQVEWQHPPATKEELKFQMKKMIEKA